MQFHRVFASVIVGIYADADGYFVSKGWYNIESGACFYPVTTKLVEDSYRFYAEATTPDGLKLKWQGGWGNICGHPTSAFEVRGLHPCDREGHQYYQGIEVQREGATARTETLNYPGGKEVPIREEMQYSSVWPTYAAEKYPNRGYAQRSGDAGSDVGAGILIGIGALILGGMIAEGNRQADEEACMDACSESRARCVELCTR